VTVNAIWQTVTVDFVVANFGSVVTTLWLRRLEFVPIVATAFLGLY
jgi:hypothetical protein